jgi:protein-S-isoprenylcysteine O-methyltransferase Ste14
MDKKYNPQRNMTFKDIILMSIETILFLAQVVVCVFFYNFLGLNLVVYLGWAVLLIALLLGWQGREALEQKGEQHPDESWLHTRTVVAVGVYAVVRHPMYLSFLLISLTLVFLSQHWLNAVFGAIIAGLLYNDMYREEQGSLEKFGDDYRHYMEQVPRMNAAAGVIRLIKRRKKKKI